MPKTNLSTKFRLKVQNNVQRLREDQLLTKAELARRAGISALTIDRVEAGKECRLDTKRKIILALGLSVEERAQVFGRGTTRAGNKGDERSVARLSRSTEGKRGVR